MSRLLACALVFFVLFNVIASAAIFAEAKTSLSPLEQFQQYRAKFGMDTAREDILDNGVIDNSINAVEFTYSEFGMLSGEQDPANKVQIQRAVLTNAPFVYHWEQNASSTGSEYSSYVNKPVVVTFLDSRVTVPDNSASQKLLEQYGILLSNDGAAWSFEDSYALLETMRAIPQDIRSSVQAQKSVTSKWILTDQHINDDIKITSLESYKTVEISKDAFESSHNRVALIDNKMGTYFSQRLHHALVWFVTDEGSDIAAVEKILNDRFGVSTVISDYARLTKQTTKESAKSFQKFHPHELVQIINMFEEMPKGFHRIDGLDYLARRADGTTHPISPQSPAVSWTRYSPGYIEFMESAFTVQDEYLHRLIIHEKSHFIWEHLFPAELKDDWAKLGGWYQDKKSASGWATTKTTEFVSAYAHQHNPDEDMAESISYFVINPDKLKSRSTPKYEFIRDRVMEGNIYVSVVREDLTFDVFNLYPDYIYPGKIIRVDISVTGAQNEDKYGTIEIELSGKGKFAGATNAYLRLISEQGTYKDVTLFPVDGKIGLVLRGEVTLSHNAKGGLWHTNQIIISDQVDNQRFKGQNDFGWKFFVNNPIEDITPPSYVKKSLKLAVREDRTQQRPIQTVIASWRVTDTQDINVCYATLDHDDLASYSVAAYGGFDTKTATCLVKFQMTEFHRTGYYSVKQIIMKDRAGNDSTISFANLEDNSAFVRTTNPDIDYPYLDTQKIKITATPTNPVEPNGETNVNIIYYAKDNKSGLGPVSFILRDPQGIQHHFYHYHKNFHGLFFDGNPSELARYDINLVLPEGSAPGKWALVQMDLNDKANNSKSYGFAEIIHFEIMS